MKLAVARSLFFVGSLAVASLAVGAWHEPAPGVISASSDLDHCPLPPNARGTSAQIRPDQDLMLLLFGLSQGLKGSN
ncbi:MULTISPECIES: hypothetical protein [Azotobacter]|uniref:hypothetical protein n=1 Tax=Azotobacter TaxID=352 RepID=UPI0005A0AE92|nr:hypothetical protein [Azotobacter vinelandii]WKN20686.1 hypothetical protein AVAEIV_003694 [Azotobacter vinelandii]